MTQPKLKLDLKKLSKSELVENLSRHLSAYEDRWKKVLRDFDVKSRDARDRSREQWDKFSRQLKDRRVELEKRVTNTFQVESKRLSRQINQGANELFNYLKSIAKNEKLTARAASNGGARKKGARSSGGIAKKKSSGKGRGAKKKKGAGAGAPAMAVSGHTSSAPFAH
jgi:hypothetical protein